jgi:hypothetical protein
MFETGVGNRRQSRQGNHGGHLRLHPEPHAGRPLLCRQSGGQAGRDGREAAHLGHAQRIGARLGLALVADEYRPVEIFLDRSELGLRAAYAKVWGSASTAQRVIVTLLATITCAVVCYWAYLYFFAKTAQAV